MNDADAKKTWDDIREYLTEVGLQVPDASDPVEFEVQLRKLLVMSETHKLLMTSRDEMRSKLYLERAKRNGDADDQDALVRTAANRSSIVWNERNAELHARHVEELATLIEVNRQQVDVMCEAVAAHERVAKALNRIADAMTGQFVIDGK